MPFSSCWDDHFTSSLRPTQRKPRQRPLAWGGRPRRYDEHANEAGPTQLPPRSERMPVACSVLHWSEVPRIVGRSRPRTNRGTIARRCPPCGAVQTATYPTVRRRSRPAAFPRHRPHLVHGKLHADAPVSAARHPTDRPPHPAPRAAYSHCASDGRKLPSHSTDSISASTTRSCSSLGMVLSPR